MNKSADYVSESDLSDEDFCPENEAASELSEVSSDDEIEDDDEKDATAKTKSTNEAGKSKKKIKKSKPTKRNEAESKRSTRQQGATIEKTTEKDALESDDDEKAHADALWADFLGDVKQTSDDVKTKKTETTSVAKKATPTATSTKSDKPKNGHVNELEKAEAVADHQTKQITITEIMDFAGEEVKVAKVVSAESIKENKAGGSSSSKATTGLKRAASPSGSGLGGGSAAAGGLGSILNHIAKKKKISVLEKTKLDWNTFKQAEGIEEDLQTFNKGKDGYLERQDFLQRTDVRQFEIERNLRQTRRNN